VMDLDTAHAVLGIGAEASLDDARRSYRSRARLLHPDRSSEELRDTAEQAMATLNEAWATVRKRMPTTAAETVQQPPMRLPNDGECALCGCAPARDLTVRVTTGLVLLWRWRRMTIHACRGCADRVYADAQATSLVRGWWGIIAPLANVVNLVRNKLAVTMHRRAIGATGMRAPEVVSPISEPLRYRTYLRPLPILATIVAAVVLASLASSEWARIHPQPVGGTLPAPAVARSSPIGTCLSAPGLPVPCSDSSASFRIMMQVAAATDCDSAGYSNAFTDRSDGTIYCALPVGH
jgi:putative hemolysin